MAICNIFRPLTKKTGTFFTFSQYMEDLTKEWAQSSNYHIVPSRYVAINGNYLNLTNDTIARKLQEQYENACAIFKSREKYNPNYSKYLFWDFLLSNDIIKFNDGIIEGVQYVDDINLQSYNEYDGMGYSEIYCYIPNEAKQHRYSGYKLQDHLEDPINVYTDEILQGYHKYELQGWEMLSYDYTYEIFPYEFSWEEAATNNRVLATYPLSSDKFDINTIVVLYNVYNTERDILYEDIPLGIYFTGTIEQGIMQNSITKFVTNEDIYNSGTSYGLRICTRFVVSPTYDNLYIKDITLEDNNYSDLTRVLAEMSISQHKMDQIANARYNQTQELKDTLSIFMNSRTNVPYIKNINGKDYWFVNGRMLNSTSGTDCDCDSYTLTEMDEVLELNQDLSVVLHLIEGSKMYDKTSDGEQTVKLQWVIKYMGKGIVPDKLYLNGVEINNALTEYLYTINDRRNSWGFEVTAVYKNKSATDTLKVSYIYPSYFGLVAEDIESDLHDHEFIPNVDQIMSLGKILLGVKEFEQTFSSDLEIRQHVVYAYPAAFGELYDIVDGNGFIYYLSHREDEYNDFNMGRVTIHDIPYLVYADRTPIMVNNQLLKFNHLSKDEPTNDQLDPNCCCEPYTDVEMNELLGFTPDGFPNIHPDDLCNCEPYTNAELDKLLDN